MAASEAKKRFTTVLRQQRKLVGFGSRLNDVSEHRMEKLESIFEMLSL
jgi:hypothetical protein